MVQSQARCSWHDIQIQFLTDASQTCFQCTLGSGEALLPSDGSCLRAAGNTHVENFMLHFQQAMAVETDRSKSPLSTSDMWHDNQPSLLFKPISSTSTYVLSSDLSLCLPSTSQSSKKLPRYIHSTRPSSLLDFSALRFDDFFQSRSYSFRAPVNCRTTAVCQSCEGPLNIVTYCNKTDVVDTVLSQPLCRGRDYGKFIPLGT